MIAVPAVEPAAEPPLVVRAARDDEAVRARLLFVPPAEPPPAAARFILGLKSHPLERIVAVLAWWREADVIQFNIARQPRIPPGEAAAALVPALEALPGLDQHDIKCYRLLADNEDFAPWLATHGYLPRHTERLFEAPFSQIYERVGMLWARHAGQMPQAWKTEPIRRHTPETVWPLIAPCRLTNFETLRTLWFAPGYQGYDPEMSNILFDAGKPLGTMLVRSDPICISVDVRVVTPMPSTLRSLANIALLAHLYPITSPTTWQIGRFRGDQTEHRETANLARRMGGRQIASRHIYCREARSKINSPAPG